MLGSWLAAGVSICLLFLFAVFAVFDAQAGALPVVSEMVTGIETADGSGLLADLFGDAAVGAAAVSLVAGIGWLATGIGVFERETKEYATAGAGLVTATLGLLLLVYSPVLSDEITTLQTVTFAVLSVVGIGGVWWVVLTQEWPEAESGSRTRQDREQGPTHPQTEETEPVGNERTVDAFDRRIDRSLDRETREQLREVAPTALEEFDAAVEQYRQTRREPVPAGDQSEPEQGGHRPETEAEQLLQELRSDLEIELREQFGPLEVTSRYGERYAIDRLQGGESITGAHSDDLPSSSTGEQLARAIESGTPLGDVAAMIADEQKRRAEMTRRIETHEQSVADGIDRTETTLEEAREALGRIGTPVGDRLEEILFEERVSKSERLFERQFGEANLPTEPTVGDRLVDARERLHDCQFEAAKRTVDDAESTAKEIKSIAIFFADSVVPTIEHGAGSIPVPADIDEAVIEAMGTEIRRSYDISYELRGETLEIEAGREEPAVEADDSTQRTESTSRSPKEDVLYLLRELRAETPDDRELTIDLGRYPEKFSDSKIIDEITTVCETQEGIHRVEPPDSRTETLTIVSATGEDPRQRIEAAIERYHDTT